MGTQGQMGMWVCGVTQLSLCTCLPGGGGPKWLWGLEFGICMMKPRAPEAADGVWPPQAGAELCEGLGDTILAAGREQGLVQLALPRIPRHKQIQGQAAAAACHV